MHLGNDEHEILRQTYNSKEKDKKTIASKLGRTKQISNVVCYQGIDLSYQDALDKTWVPKTKLDVRKWFGKGK